MTSFTVGLNAALCDAFSKALADNNVVLNADEIDPLLQRSRHADFQSNAAMSLAKRHGMKPRELAEKAVQYVQAASIIEQAEVAGPGFLNITLSNQFLSAEVAKLQNSDRLGVNTPQPSTILVDYSSPNVAKEMHVGHLRSTIIGDACVRLLEWLGHTVLRRNHIGDWGTPFGMLIEHLLDLGETNSTAELSLGDLSSFYKTARGKFENDDAFQQRARNRVVQLQAGDEETLRLWQVLIEQSQRYFLEVYEKIDVRLDGTEFRGESAYNDQLQSVLDELTDKQLLEMSDAAQCLFLDGFKTRDDEPLPLIVQKSDGGFGYAATDLAALRERTQELSTQRLLYVVGAPQRQHFEMLFAAGKKIGWLSEKTSAEHIMFGSVLGKNGKMLASRAGDSVKLVDLLNQAVTKATDIVAIKSPQFDETERADIAQAVGIGAIKYADLSTDRTRDYVFDFDKMLAVEGNTGPYLQYANARINSLLRDQSVNPNTTATIAHEAERELAIALLAFAGAVSDVSESLLFHKLATYLFELATVFNRFYAKCPILKTGSEASRDSRLQLAALTGRTLQTGLLLLGIRTPERM